MELPPWDASKALKVFPGRKMSRVKFSKVEFVPMANISCGSRFKFYMYMYCIPASVICGNELFFFLDESLWFQPTRCVNQIDDVCRDVEKTINQTIQNTLNQLEKDCIEIGALVDSTIDNDNAARSYNLRASGKGFLLLFLGCTLPIALIVNFLSSSLSDQEQYSRKLSQHLCTRSAPRL